MTKIRVNLSFDEVGAAAHIGISRQVNVRQCGHRNDDQPLDARWDNDIEGAAGELAFCKAFNLYWSEAFELKKGKRPDVGQFEIKTAREHGHRLIIYKDTPDDVIAVLVTGNTRTRSYIIHGWMRARDAKRAEWYEQLKEGRDKQYCVPQSALRPMSEVHPSWFDPVCPAEERAAP